MAPKAEKRRLDKVCPLPVLIASTTSRSRRYEREPRNGNAAASLAGHGPAPVVAVRGDELMPPRFCPAGAVAFVMTGGAWLNREDAAKLGDSARSSWGVVP